MNIGIPKEISIEEKRIFLTPQGIYNLVKEGHHVYIEKGAGLDGHFYDEDFQKVGADVVYSHEEAFKRADLIVKVMPPTEEECAFLYEGQQIISFLQLASRTPKSMAMLMEKHVTAIGAELIENDDQHKPILEIIGEIAGSMLPQIAGRFLECNFGGRGITISGIPGIPPANIVIIGGGNIGMHAAAAFIGLGAQVHVLDKNFKRLRYIDTHLQKRAITLISNNYAIERAMEFADVVIGAIFEYGKRTPIIVTKQLLKSMKQGSLVIDVAIDQGGCFETSRPTTHSDPIYMSEGIIHYCVPNIAAAVARTASRALNHIILPMISRIGEQGIEEAIKTDIELQRGVFMHNGKCTNSGLAEIFNLPYQELNY